MVASKPAQDFPSACNLKPCGQPHWNDPTLLVQVCEQLAVPSVHSSTSKIKFKNLMQMPHKESG